MGRLLGTLLTYGKFCGASEAKRRIWITLSVVCLSRCQALFFWLKMRSLGTLVILIVTSNTK